MPPLDKTPAHIGHMFSDLAGRYDLANRCLSFFQDQRWRRKLVGIATPRSGEHVLDLCTGTGDLALEFARAADVRVTGVDISEAMLAIAARKARHEARVRFETCNVMELPYPDAQFDIVSIAFGLRNLPDYQGGVSEMMRVLKPGGRLLILEFARPRGVWGHLYLVYLNHVLPVLGGWIAGHAAPYRYLAESIKSFPAREDLNTLLKSSGFQGIGQKPLSGGIALIHWAYRAGINPLRTC